MFKIWQGVEIFIAGGMSQTLGDINPPPPRGWWITPWMGVQADDADADWLTDNRSGRTLVLLITHQIALLDERHDADASVG